MNNKLDIRWMYRKDAKKQPIIYEGYEIWEQYHGPMKYGAENYISRG